MKPLVTEEMLLEVTRWEPHPDSEGYYEYVARRLNAALDPLLVEREAAIVEECARVIDQEIRWRETERDDSGFKLAAGYMRPLDELAKAIRALSAPEALARHDAAVRLEAAKLVEVRYVMAENYPDPPGERYVIFIGDVPRLTGTANTPVEALAERIRAALEGKP